MSAYYKGRLAFITGGTEGIGLEIARGLLRRGGHVVIGSRDKLKQENARKSLEQYKQPDQVLEMLHVDVSDVTSVSEFIAKAIPRFGVPFIIISCAGFAHPGYIDKLDLKIYKNMMDVNYFGTLHLIKYLLPHLILARRGHIVTVSSMAGLFGLFGYTGYCASKYAVLGFSEALRRELKPYNLCVSTLCPPDTKTPGHELANLTKPPEVLRVEKLVTIASAEKVSESLLKQLPGNPFLIFPTFDSRLVYLLSRWFPFMADLLMRRPRIV